MSLRTSVYEFLVVINIMSSATIFTSAHIAILLLSLHVFFFFFTRAHIAILLLLLLFYGTPYYWFPYCINFYAWLAQEIFVASHMCWFFKFMNFPMVFLVYEEGWSIQRLKRCDRHGDKDEDYSLKNVNNTSSQKYRQILNRNVWKHTTIFQFGTLAQRLECSPMARETWVQSQVESYQRL